MSLAQGKAERYPGQWWVPAIRLGTALVLLGLVWSLADGPQALQRLEQINWPLAGLAFLAVNLQTIISAWRWRQVACRLGLEIPISQAVSEYYLAQLINQSLPGGVMGDAARAVRLRHRSGLAVATQAVIIERMAGQIAMFSVLALGLLTAFFWPGGMYFGFAGPYLLGGLGISVVLGVALWAMRRKPMLRWASRFGVASHKALLAKGAWLEQGAFGLVIVGLNLAGFALCAEATGTKLGAEAILVLIPLVLAAMLVPVTIAGWGFREGAAAALFPFAGASAAAGLAASVTFGFVILAASLPGLFVLRGISQLAASPR